MKYENEQNIQLSYQVKNKPNGSRNLKINNVPMYTYLSSTKEARIYNGKMTTSLTSGAGKTGQPLVKE